MVKIRRNPDTGKTIAVVALAGAAAYAIYILVVKPISPPGAITISTPTVSPATTVPPGTAIEIATKIAGPLPSSISVHCLIYQGAIIGTGDLITTYVKSITNPGTEVEVVFPHITVEKSGSDDRDVEIKVFSGSTLLVKDKWADVYHVKVGAVPPGVETKTLEIDITPIGSGYVTTSPAPLDIENHWDNGDRGKFEVGTRVQVTAVPNSGYRFEKWSDEIQGGTSTNNPEWVSDNGYMVDNKAVKAHFVVGVPPPPPEEPVNVATLPAERITHNSATLVGSRGVTDYGHLVYFEYGKTTSYGLSTSKVRMYSSQEIEEFEKDVGNLQPNTTYHYRAVAEPDEPNYPDLPVGYGADKIFKTSAEPVLGFDMRVTGAATAAKYWMCNFEDGGIRGESNILSIGSTWNYKGKVSDQKVDIYWMTFEREEGGPALNFDRSQYVFRLYAGSKYRYDFAAHELYEE